MFRFFTTAKWAVWAWLGSVVILSSLWVQVQIDVRINEWFGEFYDMVQKALGEPNAVTMEEYVGGLLSFGNLAAMAITLGLATSFLTSHFLFRWRTAMVEWYHDVYDKARTIEGAAQRVQEDTIKFSRIVEGLGTSLIESILVLIEFLPIRSVQPSLEAFGLIPNQVQNRMLQMEPLVCQSLLFRGLHGKQHFEQLCWTRDWGNSSASLRPRHLAASVNSTFAANRQRWKTSLPGYGLSGHLVKGDIAVGHAASVNLADTREKGVN